MWMQHEEGFRVHESELNREISAVWRYSEEFLSVLTVQKVSSQFVFKSCSRRRRRRRRKRKYHNERAEGAENGMNQETEQQWEGRYMMYLLEKKKATDRLHCRPSAQPGVWQPGALMPIEVLGYGLENLCSNTLKWKEPPSECCVR